MRNPTLPSARRLGKPAAVLGVFVAAALVLACGRPPAQAPAAARRTVTIAAIPWPASASIYIAQDMGCFRDEGLDAHLRSYPSGNLALLDALAGKIDFAAATETPIASAAVEGKPVAVIATIAEVEQASRVIARRDRGISKAEDLKGRRVGRVAGSSAAFHLHLFLSTSFVNPAAVRAVDLAPDEVVPALLRGDVDAVSTWVPQTTILAERLRARAAFIDEPGLAMTTWNLVAARDAASREPALCGRLLRAIVRANRLIAERPAEAQSIVARHIGADVRSVAASWANYRPTCALDHTLVLSLEEQARWIVGRRRAGARRIPDLLDIVDTRPLEAVRPEAVRIAGR